MFDGSSDSAVESVGARWWMSGGLHTNETIKESIEELASYGIKEVELVTLNESNVDASTYGCFSPEWWEDCEYAIREATKHGMAISLTSGANWATTNVPNLSPDDENTSQQLDYTMQCVKAGENVTGEIAKPVPASEEVTNIKLVKVVATKFVDGYNEEQEQNAIDPETSVDLTDQAQLTDTGVNVEWTAPEGDGEWGVFAFWRYGTGQINEPSVSTAYTVNYLDKRGAQAFIDYYEENIFSDEGLVEAIKENGQVSIFMDSLEVSNQTNVFWCEDYLEIFQEKKGYDLTPYLAMIPHNTPKHDDGTRTQYFPLEDTELMQKILNDTYDVYTQIYEENYLTPIREFCHKYGMTLRAQTSYANAQNLEASEPIKYVDYVETETLNADDQPDIYRTMSGGAHVYGNKVLSSETGATFENMMLGVVDYLQMIYTEFASGVNRVMLHGYACQYGAEGTEWPGHLGISWANSEQWNVRQPQSKDYEKTFEHVTRLQKSLQAGQSQMDVAILSLNYYIPMICDFDYGEDSFGGLSNNEEEQLLGHSGWIWEDLSMQNAGYTYEFLSPNILTDTEECSYSDDVLDADGPSYQAIVVYENTLPYESAEKILEMAKQGLKVVIFEDAATVTPYNDGKDDALKEVIAELKTIENVAVVSSEEETVDALEKLGVTPRASFESPNEQILSVLRSTETEDFLHLYDYAKDRDELTTEISVEGMYKPYEVNTWNGEVEEVSTYRYENGRTIFSVTMDYADVLLYALEKVDEDNSVHAISGNAELLNINDTWYMKADENGEYTVEMNNGSVLSAQIETLEDITLTDWHLNVESWTKGEWFERTEKREDKDYTSVEGYYQTNKENIEVDLTELKSWSDIPEIGDGVAGIGTYTSTLTLPETWSEEDGAVLKFGEVSGTAEVIVNGETVTTDLNSWQADITDYVKPEDNEIQIVLATPLINAVAEGKYMSMWIT